MPTVANIQQEFFTFSNDDSNFVSMMATILATHAKPIGSANAR